MFTARYFGILLAQLPLASSYLLLPSKVSLLLGVGNKFLRMCIQLPESVTTLVLAQAWSLHSVDWDFPTFPTPTADPAL